MHPKFVLPLALLLSVNVAEAYQSFSSGGYSYEKDVALWRYWDPETGLLNTSLRDQVGETLTIASRYYLSDRQARGPLKEFDYINRISNFYGAYGYSDDEYHNARNGVLGGEYFTGNLKLGASVQDLDGEQVFGGALGYFFTPSLQATVDIEYHEGDSRVLLGGQYVYQLGDTDYLGVTLQTNDGFSGAVVSTRYFRALSNDRYLRLGLKYADTGGLSTEFLLSDSDIAPVRNIWELQGEFYFSESTSLKAEVGDLGHYRLGATHFFNRNISLSLGYTNKSDEFGGWTLDNESYSLSASVQF